MVYSFPAAKATIHEDTRNDTKMLPLVSRYFVCLRGRFYAHYFSRERFLTALTRPRETCRAIIEYAEIEKCGRFARKFRPDG
jgi:hypothetical protein